ncbi:MAG TPA: multiheme c-type cytochrome, partial [bacterium]
VLQGPEPADPACLRCHVTGDHDPLGQAAAAARPDLAAVGCEACHGPAADHAGSGHPELVPTETGGDCPPCEANRICRLCHTPAHSPGFELAGYLERVSCAGGPTSGRTRGSEE